MYEGRLEDKKDNGNLYLDSYEKPLNKIIQENSEKYGNYIIIRYWISDKELPKSNLDEKFMDNYYDAEKNDGISYFEISEYLWKDEGKGCKHDVIKELNAYIDKYCRLEIDYSKESQSHDKSFI